MRTVDAAGLGIGPDHPPRIMGVLNVSEESPYDPSVFADPGEAATFVDQDLIDEGADIVDVGLESANKRLDVLTPAEELERLDSAVEAIESVSGDAVFSIETRYHEVADQALSQGFDMVNDICGFADPELPVVCSDHDAAVVKMASPPDLERPGAVDDVDWARRRSTEWAEDATYVDKIFAALDNGGFTDKTIVDPAFGGWSESKSLEDDRETFRRLREFRALDRPILVSINRKNFLRKYVDRSTEGALPVSLGATALVVERGADIVRTHDVAATNDAAQIGGAFASDHISTEGPPIVREIRSRTRREVRRHLERIGASVEFAGTGVSHAIEIRGLSASKWQRLAAAAKGHVHVAEGTEAVMVLGTDADLARFAAALPEETDEFNTIGTVVSTVVE